MKFDRTKVEQALPIRTEWVSRLDRVGIATGTSAARGRAFSGVMLEHREHIQTETDPVCVELEEEAFEGGAARDVFECYQSAVGRPSLFRA